jgi:hypothetical protein
LDDVLCHRAERTLPSLLRARRESETRGFLRMEGEGVEERMERRIKVSGN